MPEPFGHILILDDDEDVLQAARLFLKQYVARVDTAKNPEALPELLKGNNYDVILLDMNFTRDASGGEEGFHWLGKILETDPAIVVILITAYGDVEMAVRAMKAGATDFVLKPWQNEKLLATVSSALILRKTRLEVSNLKSRQRQLIAEWDQRFGDMIGQSQGMHNIFHTIEKVAPTEANVLILGENGTGKELVARALHRHSKRADEIFMSVDMGALPENLFESELFGYVKGAFTDAREDRPGRFELASGGTLFLDEIGNLPLPLQAKLLTVLQQRSVTRIGSHQARPVDIRLICASNKAITQMVSNGEFRRDLLYRINTIEILVPSLRERHDDISLIAEYYLHLYARKYDKQVTSVTSDALKLLAKYKWPGNIRELMHAVERAVIMTEKHSLQPDDFHFLFGNRENGNHLTGILNLEELEKNAIRKALEKNEGNITQAADDLGLTRAALYRRMEKYDL